MPSRLVWDDDHRGPPPEPARQPRQPPPGDGVVRIKREVQGRGGKTVTSIDGLGLAPPQLEALARDLKKQLGCGGSVEAFTIVLQGDRRDRVQVLLEARGYRVKRAGG
ncbi:MAG: stress response translation initiation inhibitor YciH [Planctomycetota bacterium]